MIDDKVETDHCIDFRSLMWSFCIRVILLNCDTNLLWYKPSQFPNQMKSVKKYLKKYLKIRKKNEINKNRALFTETAEGMFVELFTDSPLLCTP